MIVTIEIDAPDAKKILDKQRETNNPVTLQIGPRHFPAYIVEYHAN